MTFFSKVAEVVKNLLIDNIPAPVEMSTYRTGMRVEYIDPDITPTHYGTVVRTWSDRVKVQFDGFDLGTWIEEEAIRRYEP